MGSLCWFDYVSICFRSMGCNSSLVGGWLGSIVKRYLGIFGEETVVLCGVGVVLLGVVRWAGEMVVVGSGDGFQGHDWLE